MALRGNEFDSPAIDAKPTEGATRETDEEDLRVGFRCKYEANQREQDYERALKVRSRILYLIFNR